jgi:hypothetical protein
MSDRGPTTRAGATRRFGHEVQQALETGFFSFGRTNDDDSRLTLPALNASDALARSNTVTGLPRMTHSLAMCLCRATHNVRCLTHSPPNHSVQAS